MSECVDGTITKISDKGKSDGAKTAEAIGEVLQEPGWSQGWSDPRPPEPSVFSVQREHIAFLREMLKEKQLWFEPVLLEHKAEIEALRVLVSALQQQNTRIKVALAGAISVIDMGGVDCDTADWGKLLEQ